MPAIIRYQVQEIKSAAAGRWPEILTAVAGIPAESLDDSREHPCPKCVGDTRFRFIDVADGAVRCSHCFADGCGDGIAAVQWMRECTFPEALELLAEHLGIGPPLPAGQQRDPLELVARAKRVSVEALQAYGARADGRKVVIPSYGPDGQPSMFGQVNERPVLFAIWPAGSEKQRKGLLPKGSKGKAGVFLPHRADGSVRLPAADETWHVAEGPKDPAALHDLGLLAMGLPTARMNPKFGRLLAGVDVVLVPDLDVAGQEGAQATAARLHGGARSVRIARLPGEVIARDGKDVRDILAGVDGELVLREALDDAQLWRPPGPDGIDADAEPQKKSQATLIVELTQASGAELWHSDSEAYITLPDSDHRATLRLHSKSSRQWLGRLLYSADQRVPGSQAITDARLALEGIALYDGPEHPVAIRLAAHDDRLYLDLCDARWKAVEIDASGWRVLDDPPVRFRRANGMLPLPAPVPGGSIAELREYINVTDDQWPLLLAWLVAAYRDVGPYPVLCLHGEQGAAKSTTAEVLRELVDPSKANLRGDVREPRDLMIAAHNGWIIALDNLSHLPGWLSDCLCRIATGGGFSTRTLYENDEETIFNAQRPTILTGIEAVATRGDLLDRSLLLSLPTIPEAGRKPESAFWSAFDHAKPRILGALLDAVAGAIRRLPETHLSRSPRMADFALWATAAEVGLGLADGDFMRSYAENRAAGNVQCLEASPLAGHLLALGDWHGTFSDLLAELNDRATDSDKRMKSWPKAANRLSGAIRRLAPNLRAAGLEVEFTEAGRGRGKRAVVRLAKSTENIGPIGPIGPGVQEHKENVVSGADTGADGADHASFGADPSSSQNALFDGTGADGADGADHLHRHSNSARAADDPKPNAPQQQEPKRWTF